MIKKTINRESLLKITRRLKRYIPSKYIVESAAMFLIKDNAITIDNQEVRITILIPQEGGIDPLEGLELCVSAASFCEAMENMSSDVITLKIGDKKLTVADPIKKKGVEINMSPATVFLFPKEGKGDTVFLPIPSKYVMPALKKAAAFVSSDSMGAFACVGVSVRDEAIYINGGNASNMYETKVDIPGINNFSALLSINGANAIQELEESEEVILEKRGNYIFCSDGTIKVQVICMEGKYPDTRVVTSLMPKEVTLVSKDDIASALRLCSTIKTEMGYVSISPSEGIRFLSENDMGEAAEQEVACDNKGINEPWHYILAKVKKMVAAIDAEDIIITANNRGLLFMMPSEQRIGTMEVCITGPVMKME